MSATDLLRGRDAKPAARRWWRRYPRQARRPAHTILLLAPLVLVHEVGMSLAPRGGAPNTLVAHGMIQELLSWVGLVGALLPAASLAMLLFAWHAWRRDSWRTDVRVLLAMAGESVALAIPLLVWSAVLSGGAPWGDGAARRLLLALGAGVYEELVFRFVLLGGLTWLLVRVLAAPETPALVAATAISASVFAACHFSPIGQEPLTAGAFLFQFVAGAYLGAVFVGRGLGVAAATHAMHNVAWMVWRGG